MPEIKGDPAAARPETVTVYDPQREQVVDVPSSQAALMEKAGYKVGPAADMEAEVQGLPGKVASFMMGAANGGTFGQFQHLVPKSLRDVQRQVEEAHPVLHGAGEMATGTALTAAAPGGIYGRVAASAAQGAGEEMARAVKYNQPIAAERVLQGAGIGAFLGLAGEGMAFGAKAAIPAAKGALGKLAGVWPKDEAGKYVRNVGFEALWAGAQVLPKPFIAAVAGADRAATLALNNLGTIHGALDALQRGPVQGFAKTTRALMQGSAPLATVSTKNLDEEYAEKTAQVSKAAADPQGLQNWLDATYGHAFREHPELQQGIAVRAQMAATILNEHMPKDPEDPSIQGRRVDPPRSAKLDWLRHYHAANNPLEALQNPTPGTMQTMEEIHPETVHLVRQAMLAYAMSPAGRKMNAAQARRISIIIGGPVRPQNSSGYVQRLAQTHVDAQAAATAAQPSTSGSKSATPIDATNMQQMMIGQ